MNRPERERDAARKRHTLIEWHREEATRPLNADAISDSERRAIRKKIALGIRRQTWRLQKSGPDGS